MDEGLFILKVSGKNKTDPRRAILQCLSSSCSCGSSPLDSSSQRVARELLLSSFPTFFGRWLWKCLGEDYNLFSLCLIAGLRPGQLIEESVYLQFQRVSPSS